MVNFLERANLPHYFEEKENLLYVYSKYFTDLLQTIFNDFLLLELQWNFLNSSDWFLETIQDYVEFVSPLLEQLKNRAVLPFLNAFGLVGTYQGFAQACIGLFGDEVVIEYIDGSYTINISNITSDVFEIFIGEGRSDFNFLLEDGSGVFRTEDIVTPPSGQSTLIEILRQFLPAEHSEIVTINLVS